MKKQHLIGVVIFLLIGYAAGVLFPGPGQTVKAKVSGAA